MRGRKDIQPQNIQSRLDLCETDSATPSSGEATPDPMEWQLSKSKMNAFDSELEQLLVMAASDSDYTNLALKRFSLA